MSLEISTFVASNPNSPTIPPEAFTAGMWSIADAETGGDAVITITGNPGLGDALWFDLFQYRVDGGAWTPIPGTNAATTFGDFTLENVFTDGVEADVQIRAVVDLQPDGGGPASDTKQVTTTAGVADTTAPVLSALTASANGATSWTGSVATDEANGTLFYLVSTNTSEGDAAVKAGQSRAVNATGTIPLSGGGLTAETTYYLHALHTDAAGNDSAQPAPVSFTTGAAGVATGSLTATLAKATNPAVTPHKVHFDLSVSGGPILQGALAQWDPTHQGYHYVTNWGDPGAVSDKVLNVPTQWNDLNVSYGKHPAHVYTKPGTYTATFWCFDLSGTLIGETTASITVNDPDTLFSGNRTILYDPDNVGDNSTYPGSQVVTSWAAAYTALRNLNQTGRILLKRGSIAQITSTQVIRSFFDNFYVGAWGSGARPIIQLPNSNSINAGGNSAPGSLFNIVDSADFSSIFSGVDIVGPWNPVNESGGQYRCITSTTSGDNRRILVHDCNIRGFAWGVGTLSNGNDGISICINNTSITDWGDYGVWQSSNRNDHLAIIGTAIYQNPNALQGGDGFGTANGAKRFISCQHGPIRASMRFRTYIDVCDFFNRSGWFINSGEPTAQPCMRAHFSSDLNPSVYPHTSITRTSMEGGGQAIFQLKDQNDGSATNSGGAINLLLDKVLIVATADTWCPFNVAWTGWTMRNSIMVFPDEETRNNAHRGFFDSQDLSANSRAINPVQIYNCTFVSLKTAASLNGATARFDEDIDGSNFTNDYTQENNALYQVSGTSEAIDVDLSTPMPTVGGVWTSRYLGTRWSNVGAPSVSAQLTLDTSVATPAGVVTTFEPNSSSPLVNDATSGLTAYDDFYGRVRVGPRDRGAVERA
ncbi:MAG: hypothetical protein AAFY43_01740 [Pseudomonadota bacterium]